MKKVCLLMQDKDQDAALKKLRDIGVFHLEKSGGSSDKLSKVIERKNRGESAMGLIQHHKAPKKKPGQQPQGGGRERRAALAPGQRRGRRATDQMGMEELEPYSLDAVNAPDRPDLINLMAGMGIEFKTLQDREVFLVREMARVEAWGEFDPALLKELAGMGQPVFLYELTPEVFATIPKDTRYIKMEESKVAVRLVVLDKEIPGVSSFHLPEKALSALAHEEKEVKFNLERLDARIKTFADRRPVLAKDMLAIQHDIEFEEVRTVLEPVQGVAAGQGLSYFTGYVPAEDMDRLKQAASEDGWALMFDDPDIADEKVPTKLKNNKFVQFLYPLTNFLEITPGYREIDISPTFLFFFTVFFGMIWGDAGYGLLLFLVAIIGIIKTAKTAVPTILKFLLLMGISTTAWGVLTCSWFAIPIARLPHVLIDISLPWISTAKGTEQAIVNQNLQLFCFSLGLLQLSIAHLIGIKRNLKAKSLKVFADIGQLAMLWGMYNVVLFFVVNSSKFPIQMVSIYLLAGGFFLNFLFGYYQGSVAQSILSSLKNIISVILGVTSVFSDIMSYIRLWAVGLAGATIAITINTMAGPMLGNFLIFAGIILLTAGHGMNLVLNVLAVLVHAVRLNILEFSSHVGLLWAGTAYKPFAEKGK